MTVITVAGRPFAAAMYWQIGGVARDEALDRARRIATLQERSGANASDLICLRATIPLQFGLTSSKSGDKAGLPVLAAILADSRPDDWMGVFAVDSGFLIIEIRRGLVRPDGDTFLSRDAVDLVKELVAKAVKSGDFKEVVAPASFAIDGTKEISLQSLLTGRHWSAPRLRKLSGFTWAGLRWWLGLVTIIAGGLAYWAMQGPDQPENEASKIELPPWRKDELARAPAMVKACTAAVFGRAALPGFALTMIECTRGQVRFSYRQTGRSAMQWLKTTPSPIPAGFWPDAAAPPCQPEIRGPGSMEMGCAMPPIPTLAEPMTLLGAAQTREILWRAFGGMGSVRIDLPAGAPAAIQSMAVTWSGIIPPDDILSGFTAIPAMTVDKVKFTMPRNWTVEGRAYAH